MIKLTFMFDIDNTICEPKTDNLTYEQLVPFKEAVETLKELKSLGHKIILHTGRHMRTCEGNQGAVLAKQGRTLLNWLEEWDIPYDELWMNKPHADLIIDDAAHKHTDWESTRGAINDRIVKGPRTPENP